MSTCTTPGHILLLLFQTTIQATNTHCHREFVTTIVFSPLFHARLFQPIANTTQIATPTNSQPPPFPNNTEMHHHEDHLMTYEHDNFTTTDGNHHP
ncbi:hypothetical protein RND81_02G149900 [Saponaria officinalis]|uniref:Secreted protein n=1 Tax=Saponaria officinalis TaxID=3572 RepID=A0AAW1MX96_SAPOF